jgi:hypothetical protein
MHSESISRYTATAFGNIKQVVDNEIIHRLLTLRFRSTTGGSGVAMAKYVEINAAHRNAIPVAFNALLKEQSPCVEVRESLNTQQHSTFFVQSLISLMSLRVLNMFYLNMESYSLRL